MLGNGFSCFQTMTYEITPIAHIRTDFQSKFGIPRQSGLVNETEGRIIFEPPYRVPEALRGLEEFSHIWLLWDFSEVRDAQKSWSPTVRPPRLGGNTRMGVFATRSPFRPNNIGLSSVQLLRIALHTPEGPILYVRGADLLDGTPIFDIKPYLPFTDAHPDASGGFTDVTHVAMKPLEVIFSADVESILDAERLVALRKILEMDPRPHYQHDAERIYGIAFAGKNVRFKVSANTLFVLDIETVG